MISQTVLVVSSSFGATLSATAVARAIARGIVAGGQPEPDLCPLGEDFSRASTEELRGRLDALDFDTRMRRARAVVLAERHLQESTLRGSAAFEIATRARQGGVPAYGVTAKNTLTPFDARVLDLQVILEASAGRALTVAGTKLAQVV